MLFANANLFVDGRFTHGAFRGENGRLTDISAYAAASAADLYAPVNKQIGVSKKHDVILLCMQIAGSPAAAAGGLPVGISRP